MKQLLQLILPLKSVLCGLGIPPANAAAIQRQLAKNLHFHSATNYLCVESWHKGRTQVLHRVRVGAAPGGGVNVGPVRELVAHGAAAAAGRKQALRIGGREAVDAKHFSNSCG